MIAMGCKYLRICHLNNCATGVATQREDLINQHFIGEKQKVINYFEFIANDVRQHLKEIGVTKLEDIIGQTHYLEQIYDIEDHYKKIDLSGLLETNSNSNESHFCTVKKNKPWDKGNLSRKIMAKATEFIDKEKKGTLNFNISNRDRSIGASVSGYIAEKYGENGLKNTLALNFKGSAGQSFGCWNASNLNLTVDGDANDYVGKGMAAGEIIVYPPKDKSYKAKESVIIGNTCMYGATGGKLYASGIAGERFAVRNSGATAIVEGVGDHGCEYMTNGTVIILGNTGINFGAGMSGGFAIVLDEDGDFKDKYNPELVEAIKINVIKYPEHEKFLKNSIIDYVNKTKSEWGQIILNDFDKYLEKFLIVKPKNLKIEDLFNKESVAA
jgi:glutamate synthase (NADPH/NADH) large chain